MIKIINLLFWGIENKSVSEAKLKNVYEAVKQIFMGNIKQAILKLSTYAKFGTLKNNMWNMKKHIVLECKSSFF